jgi:hypothetical protein
MGKIKISLLILIIIIGLVLRLYRFDGPIADWHSWRQADTSSVSRIFAKEGFDLLHPRYQDLSNVPSGLDNPNGYRFVEFPIYNLFQAGFYKILPFLTLEEWGRVVTIVSSLFSTLFIFLILRKHQNENAGLIGALFYAVLPYSVYYGRVILPDPSMVAATLAGIYFFDVWIENSKTFKVLSVKFLLPFILSIIFTILAFLLKPYALIFTLPMLYLAFARFGKKTIINPYLWVFAILTILPLVGWRTWITQFPEGIPGSDWLFNSGNIRFKGAYFYWIYADRIARLILGYFGIAIFISGFLTKIKKQPLYIYSFLISSLLYLTIIARGNVQHDYYQILILPTICIFLGLGGDFLINQTKNFSYKWVGAIIFIICTAFTLMFGWYHVRDYFNINNQAIIKAGQAVSELTPKNAKVIANYNGDTSFLYQTQRQGWASYEKELPEMIKMGADYLVIANPVPMDFVFAKNYKTVKSVPEYVIFDLRKTK